MRTDTKRVLTFVRAGGKGQRLAPLEQVPWNLLQNSADAMSGSGNILITTRESGDTVGLVVSDDGPGMKPEVLAKAFQPFFTTKPRGNGLGLSVCRKILDAHGGDLVLESGPGKGTKVGLTFPSARPAH